MPTMFVKFFVLCEIESGYFRPNIETDESAYFGLKEITYFLQKKKNNEETNKKCAFQLTTIETGKYYFD